MKDAPQFRTENDVNVPSITAEQMREVDRIAVEEFGLGILRMMENAGRNLAGNALDLLDGASKRVTFWPGRAVTVAEVCAVLDTCAIAALRSGWCSAKRQRH